MKRPRAYKKPFRHWVWVNAFDDALIDAAASEFPGLDDPRWKTYTEPTEAGKAESQHSDLLEQPSIATLFKELESMKAFLERLTDIDDLECDYYGGGLHQSGPGARLALHHDFTYHPSTGRQRRLNMLLYLNRKWDAQWGGQLVLAEDNGKVTRQIVPEANTLVVFETGTHSWHGHPQPLTCPAGVTRKSLAMYWYSAPESNAPPITSTVWHSGA